MGTLNKSYRYNEQNRRRYNELQWTIGETLDNNFLKYRFVYKINLRRFPSQADKKLYVSSKQVMHCLQQPLAGTN